MRRVVFVGVLLAAAVVTSRVDAHTAASGWEYPLECCSGNDCYEIDSSEVTPNRDGSYTINKSSEIFIPPNQVGGKNFKWSPDGRFHRCTYSKQNDSTPSICLFIPQPGV